MYYWMWTCSFSVLTAQEMASLMQASTWRLVSSDEPIRKSISSSTSSIFLKENKKQKSVGYHLVLLMTIEETLNIEG